MRLAMETVKCTNLYRQGRTALRTLPIPLSLLTVIARPGTSGVRMATCFAAVLASASHKRRQAHHIASYYESMYDSFDAMLHNRLGKRDGLNLSLALIPDEFQSTSHV